MSKLILGLFLFIALITFIPSFYGFWNPPENSYFITLNGEDEYSYLSRVYQSMRGHWLFKSPHIITPSEPTGRVFYRPFYLLLGKISALTQGFFPKIDSLSLAPIYIYNLFRPISAFLLLTNLYLFVYYLTKNPWQRLFLFLFTAISGGIGWTSIFHPRFSTNFGTSSIANILNDANTFWTMQAYPHQAISQALIVLTFLLFLKHFQTQSSKFIIMAGLSALFLLAIHPTDFPTIYLIPAFFLLLFSSRKKPSLIPTGISKFYPVIVIFLISFLAPLYYSHLARVDPRFAAWSTVRDLTPPPHKMFLPLFGLLNILALLGFYQILKSKKGRNWQFLIVWAVTQSLLLYAPFHFQRRLVNGLHIPLALLSAFGVWETFKLWPKKIRISILTVVFLACSLSAPFYIYRDIFWLKVGSKRNFLSREVLAGLSWLSINTTLEETVLGPRSEISLAIPALGGNQSFFGHWFKREFDIFKFRLMDSFFSADETDLPNNFSFLNTENAKEFLTVWGIRYVFLDKEQYPHFDSYYPSKVPYLTKQFENKTVAIYKTSL